MVAIASAPYVLKDVVLTVETDSYEAHVSSVQFVPTTSTITWQGLTPDAAFTDTTSPSWTCTLAYAQDWTTPNSLSQYLSANAGQQKTIVFQPLGATAGDPMFTATVTIAPGPIGGAVNTVQVGTVTLGVAGTPVKGTVV